VIERIQQNSWWAEHFSKGTDSLQGFTYSFAGEKPAITEVPVEPLESLLLQVRKLTMDAAPENMLKVRKELKAAADKDVFRANPTAFSNPFLFLRNIFNWTVANLCRAAMGLKWYIDSKDSPQGFVMTGYPPVVFEFVLYRNPMAQMDEQYKVFSDWIDVNGGCPHGRWGG
jgi:hypothetical protein